MTAEQFSSFMHFIISAVMFGAVIYSLYLIARTLVSQHEHHLWSARCKKYNRWLKDYEERKSRMSKEEFEEVMDHLHVIVLGGNKDMRGPWEDL